MDPPSLSLLPLAEAINFEEWFEIATKWKMGKDYRRSPPQKDEKVDGSKGKLVGLLTPPAIPFKSNFPSSLDSSTGVKTPSPPPPAQASHFKNEFFEVRVSPKGGLGCFARKDIKRGTEIHSEKPLFVSCVVQVYYHFEQLTVEEQAAYLKLHCWHGLASHKIIAIFQTNRFLVAGGKCGVFLNSSRFNHACPDFRNCSYKFKKDVNKMFFTAISDIVKGEEITIAYSNSPNELYENYGFFCDCPGCPRWEDQHKKWKFEDGLKKQASMDRGESVRFDRKTYPANSAWENDLYKW